MRSYPAILLAALTVVAITVSVILTASHFGMRDWPTPPMPDSATRLITPTEAAAKARERLSKGDDPAEVTIAGDAGTEARHSERSAAERSTRRAGTRSRRSSSRRGTRSGRRSGEHRSGEHRSGGRDNNDSADQSPAPSGGDTETPAQEQPATPQAAPAAPVTQASSGDQTQARPDEPASPPATQPAIPAPSLPPVVPPLPTAPAPSSGDDSPGRGHGRRRGPIRNLLGHLL